MDMVKEMYRICADLQETEESLTEANKKLAEYIESNVSAGEKVVFFDTINTIIKAREEYFFKSGFRLAVKLLMN